MKHLARTRLCALLLIAAAWAVVGVVRAQNSQGAAPELNPHHQPTDRSQVPPNPPTLPHQAPPGGLRKPETEQPRTLPPPAPPRPVNPPARSSGPGSPQMERDSPYSPADRTAPPSGYSSPGGTSR